MVVRLFHKNICSTDLRVLFILIFDSDKNVIMCAINA
jgi:hypothetical protein